VWSQALIVYSYERSETTQPTQLHLHDLNPFFMMRFLNDIVLWKNNLAFQEKFILNGLRWSFYDFTKQSVEVNEKKFWHWG